MLHAANILHVLWHTMDMACEYTWCSTLQGWKLCIYHQIRLLYINVIWYAEMNWCYTSGSLLIQKQMCIFQIAYNI
jgi:hypothetical protein